MRVTSPLGITANAKRVLRVAGLLIVLGVSFVTLRDNMPDPGQMWTALGSAGLGWLLLALVAEATSLRHFALQQRRLLAGFGVGMSLHRAMAVTVSRSAISFSLPAGSAVSAGFAFRQFRTAGASRRAATAVTVLSGLLSGVALILMYGLVMLIPSGGVSGEVATATVVLVILLLATLVFGADWLVSRRRCAVLHPDHVAPEPEPGAHGPVARFVAATRRTLATLRELSPRSWVLSLAHATVNWATDFACLAATAAAFDLDISMARLATVYVTVQLVRQIPLSPGGIGVVEVALLAGLISAGAAEGPAAAAMLVYRVISCWLIIPVGALSYAVLRKGSAEPEEFSHVPARPVDATSRS